MTMEYGYSSLLKVQLQTRIVSLVLVMLLLASLQPVHADGDLVPGSFIARQSQTLVCWQGFVQLKQVASVEPAKGGCGSLHYLVVQFGYDENGQPVPLDTLGQTNNAAEFLSWYNNHWIEGDSVGDFSLHVYVRDSGCEPDWQPTGELPYSVMPEFSPGIIGLPDNNDPNVRDTVYLKNGKVYVSVPSFAPASGGSGVYHYEWLRGVKKIGFEESLTNYKITTPGYVRLRRNVKDSVSCNVAISKGVYQLKVYEELMLGAIEVENTPGYDSKIYCSLVEALADTIFATPASGGSGSYLYQWYVMIGTTVTPIAGATGCNLPLAMVFGGTTAVPDGQDYVFIRKVKDDTHFTEFSESDNRQIVHKMQDFNGCIDGYVHNKFGVMLYVDNNPDNHEAVDGTKLHFKSYQWYKNCLPVEGQTEQYYSEDGQQLDGIYTVIMTADDGREYLSCPIELHPASAPAATSAASAVVYPVPVEACRPVVITCPGGKADIYSYTGDVVNHVACPGQNVTISAPCSPGIYYVSITGDDGAVRTEKLIVK